jgi:hypothetical protein
LAEAMPLTLSSAVPATANKPGMCAPNRFDFERLLSARLETYERTADSAARAGQWRRQIDVNIAARRATPDLDALFGRYSRYCAEGDTFMAGFTVGEWVGIALREQGSAR